MPDADLTERIARVLQEHADEGFGEGDRCECGWTRPLRPGAVRQGPSAHRAHQAEAVAAVVQDEVERLRGGINAAWDDAVAALRERDEARAEVERLQGRLASVESYAQRRAIGERARGRGDAERAWLDLLALMERPRITTTWGEPDGIGGPRKPHVGRTETWDLDGKVQ